MVTDFLVRKNSDYTRIVCMTNLSLHTQECGIIKLSSLVWIQEIIHEHVWVKL